MRVDTYPLERFKSKFPQTCYACGKSEVNYYLRIYKNNSLPQWSKADNHMYVCSETCITLITLFSNELSDRPLNIFGHKEY